MNDNYPSSAFLPPEKPLEDEECPRHGFGCGCKESALRRALGEMRQLLAASHSDVDRLRENLETASRERDAARLRAETAEGLLSEVDGSLIGQYGRPLPPTCEWSVPCLHHRIAAFLAGRGGSPAVVPAIVPHGFGSAPPTVKQSLEAGEPEPGTGGEKPGGSHG